MKENVLQEALETVTGSRNDAHGPPYLNMRDAADMWAAILKMPVTPEQVSLCMIAFKIARQSNNSSRDNIVDIAGYCWVLEKCLEAEGIPL
jgi:hypothetical protein